MRYEVDDTQAKFGAHSLKMTVDRNRASMALGTFAMPFERDAKYVLSFYAKGSLDQGLRFHVWGRGQAPALWGNKPNHPTFDISGEWKRYTFDFISQLNFGCLFFEGRLLGDSRADEATIWLDGIQLERDGVTDYVEPPVAAQLLSAARGNFLRFGQDPELRLVLRSAPDTELAATLDVRDFFGRDVFRKTLELRTDGEGNAEIRLPELGRTIRDGQLRGIFPVTCELTSPAFEGPFLEFFRFSVMNFLDNTHKNKTLVQHGYRITPQLAGAGMDRFLARERAVGVGACCQIGPEESSVAVDKQRSELVAAHGIEQLGRPVVVRRHGSHGHGKIVEDDGRVVMDNIKKRVNVTDQELAQFERICALKATRRPWVKQWYFAAECKAGLQPLSDDLDSFCKFLLATLRGIKKGNPDARVLITGGPWNMSPTLGVKWLESYIRKTRELDPDARFDGCAIHIYRRQPENPDLDAEAAALLEMLDRNGVDDWPVYWNEGLNYFEYNLPILGATPYQGNSVKNFHGTLSYDLGRAERISVAFRARSWLVALKYHDRVKAVRDFAGEQRMYLDHDLTAGAAQKVINTLGRILGNATFHRDIRFAPECRCYVFIDQADRPVAAIWGHSGLVDRWKQEAPKVSFDFSQSRPRILDLMENERQYPTDADGRSILPVGSWPVFVIGAPGAADDLCRAVAGAQPVSAAVKTVAVSAHPEPDGTALVVFRNLISRKVRGEARVTLNGTPLTRALTLAPLAEERVTLKLADPAGESTSLRPFDFECALNGRVTAIANPYLLLGASSGAKVVVDGQPGDWRDRPAAALGGNATVRFAIANGTLYLAVETIDNRPNALAGLGVYIDPIVAPETWSQAKAPIDNVFVYELQPRRTAPDGLAAYRWHAPGVQADSGSAPRGREHATRAVLRRVIRRQDAFLEIAFPPYCFMPLKLEPGSRFGVNVSLPDRTGKTAAMLPFDGYENIEHPGPIRFAMALVSK